MADISRYASIQQVAAVERIKDINKRAAAGAICSIYGEDQRSGIMLAITQLGVNLQSATLSLDEESAPMQYEGYPVPKHMGEELVLLREVVQSLLQAHFHHRKLKAADFDNIRLLEQYGITITKPPKDFIPSSIYTMAMQKDDML